LEIGDWRIGAIKSIATGDWRLEIGDSAKDALGIVEIGDEDRKNNERGMRFGKNRFGTKCFAEIGEMTPTRG
jgi:hypothetical protein